MNSHIGSAGAGAGCIQGSRRCCHGKPRRYEITGDDRALGEAPITTVLQQLNREVMRKALKQ